MRQSTFWDLELAERDVELRFDRASHSSAMYVVEVQGTGTRLHNLGDLSELIISLSWLREWQMQE